MSILAAVGVDVDCHTNVLVPDTYEAEAVVPIRPGMDVGVKARAPD